MSINMNIENIKASVFYDPVSGLIRSKETLLSIGKKNKRGYVIVRVAGNELRAHRLAWFLYYGNWPIQVIDHINGNRSDNRIINLRDVSPSENRQNTRNPRTNSKSGLLGVTFKARDNIYEAAIKLNGKSIYLGSFKNPMDAHFAYIDAKRKMHPANTL